jgi:hypothetical protein
MGLRLIKIIRGFREGSRLDWLHPSNGPLPDFAGIYQRDDEKFEVLAWDDSYSWITMVCGPDWFHGGYPMSYRWWPGEDSSKVWCRPNKGDIYDVDVKPNGQMLKQIAAASVHVHIMTEPWPEGWV